jgi:hypothetical protein
MVRMKVITMFASYVGSPFYGFSRQDVFAKNFHNALMKQIEIMNIRNYN